MYNMFYPPPHLVDGCTISFEADLYHVEKNGKRISTGEVISVDDDLIHMKHFPDLMVIKLAKIRKLIRNHRDNEKDDVSLYHWLPERGESNYNTEECGSVSQTVERSA